MTNARSTSHILAVSVVALAMACDKRSASDTAVSQTELTAATTDGGRLVPGSDLDNAAPGGIDELAGTSAPLVTRPTERIALSDAQIVKVLETFSRHQVSAGELATLRATDPEVKNFADWMIDHHHEARASGQRLVDRLKVAPADSDRSMKLAAIDQASLATLQKESATAFDRAYMRAEVADLERMLILLDRDLYPNSRDESLQRALDELRPKLAAHKRAAEALAKRL
jgi:putative membrane protein